MAFWRRMPARWIVAIHCFCALFFVFVLRLSFSVSIVCMVKTPTPNETLNAILVDGNGTYNATSYQTLIPDGRAAEKCVLLQSDSQPVAKEGEFEWSKAAQGELLGAISYGYIATQILGGWLARRYGTRRILGYSMMGMNLCCLLTPVAARWSFYCLFAIRVIGGLFMGVSLPAVYNITTRWVPPLERSFFMSVSNSGYAIGNTVAFAVSGVLCEVGFDGGWPSIFYIFGTASSVWLITWFLQVYDTPAQHPRITAEERSYIESRLESDNRSEKDFPTPWLSILTSLPFWGNFCCFFADDWVNYTLQLGQVVYMKEVLKYDITQNGLLTAIPTLGTFFMSFFVGYLADLTQKKKWLSTINTRRIFQLVSFVAMGIFLIATGFVTCENRVWAVVLLTTGRVFYTFCKGGFTVNAMDFAPRYCGEIVGILNSLGTIPGFLSPIAISILTPNGTQKEWQNVFYLAGGISIFGALGFCVLARGEVQKWALEAEVIKLEVTEHMLGEEISDEKLSRSCSEVSKIGDEKCHK